MSAPDVAQIEQARAKAAAAYPEHLTDSLGRTHPCIPRAAILRGDWDQGEAVRRILREGRP
jgi:hypothetical protein